jgi:hypothetical protein
MHPLTDMWWERLITRTDGALRGSHSGWRYDPAPLTKEELSAALEGRQPLGTYAVSPKGQSRWLCLDADDDQGRERLLDLALDLNPHSTIFELSRRGGHLWWLCPPTDWRRVQAVGQQLARDYGLDCEVFPKGPGRNGVRLPLTPHPKTGETYPVIDPGTGAIRSIEELQTLRREVLPQLALPEPMRSFEHALPHHGEYVELYHEVSRVTDLRQYAPERAIGRCPFHDDRNPSLSLLGGFWRCWAGCGQGGIYAWRRIVSERGMEVNSHAIYTT